jgi:hypothetical protein
MADSSQIDVSKLAAETGTPLIGHRVCDALEGSAAFFPAIWSRRQVVQAFTFFSRQFHHLLKYVFCRGQWQQAMKPEPRLFLLHVAELVGLDGLRPFTNLRPQHIHGIFQGDSWTDFLCMVPQGKSSSQGFNALLMFRHTAPIRRISGKGDGRAGRMKNYQIPESSNGLLQDLQYVTLNMVCRMILGGKEIAAPGVMVASTHGTADNAAEFASDQNFHLMGLAHCWWA